MSEAEYINVGNSEFGSTPEELAEFISLYSNRKFAEDVEALSSLHLLSKLEASLQVDFSSGLSSQEDFSARIAHFGSNKRRAPKRKNFLELAWEAFEDPIVRILLVMGVVSLFIGIFLSEHPDYGWIEGFAIILAVIIVVLVAAINNYQKEKKFDDLQKTHKNRQAVTVLRDGKYEQMHPGEVLVGDLLVISDGNIIPADGILIDSANIEVDESAMTGENERIKKDTLQNCLRLKESYMQLHPDVDIQARKDLNHAIPSPICLSGTTIAEGRGLMLVLAVGEFSAEGKIMELSEQSDTNTPLQDKLHKVATDVSKIGAVASGSVVVILVLRYGIEIGIGQLDWDTTKGVAEIVRYVLVGITVLAVAIPEGLPLAVAISLSYSVKKMQNDKNLVKRLHACETMGGANYICSDKTGTLTTNEMTVAAVILNKSILEVENTQIDQSFFDESYFTLLKLSIALNSTAFYETYIDEHSQQEKTRTVGSKTELAMIKFLMSLGHDDYLSLRSHYFLNKHKLFPFSSKRKRSSIVISDNVEGSTPRVFVKGAPEALIEKCTSYVRSTDSTLKSLGKKSKKKLLELLQMVNERGMRSICLAYRDLNGWEHVEDLDEHGFPQVENEDLTLLAIMAIRDPVRPQVPEAVQKCKLAGVKVIMVTGDNEVTARSIAKDCNILTHETGTVMLGSEFASKIGDIICHQCRTKICKCPRDPRKAKEGETVRVDVVGDIEKFKEIVQDLCVLARSRPEDKYALVTGLKELNNTVAVTGDGTNDAPALKKADIGFAMGIAGTELARETADIILMDDNFSSIVKAVQWGRNIYDNIRRFIQFQLTVNVTAVTTALVGAISVQQSPLTAVQLIWLNLIIDSFASLALATEPPTESLLKRPPHNKKEYIVTKMMWKHILGQSLIKSAILLTLMFAGEWILPEFGSGTRIMYNPEDDRYVRSGRNYRLDGSKDYREYFDDLDIGPSRHFTYIFNIFVLMQIFNQLNCRRIRDEWNIFEGIHKSYLFIIIWFLTILVQALIVQFGGFAFNTHLDGLTVEQWFICIAFAMVVLPWRCLLILIPPYLKDREIRI